MTRESLLQMLEKLAGRVRSLERDNKQVALTIQGFEREVGKLGAVIALASEKVSEMLKDGATAGSSQPQAVNALAESKGLEPLGGLLTQRKNRKWRSGSAFRFD